MDKNGKLFGKISIIDILAVIIIVAVIAGTVYKFSSPNTSVSAGQKMLAYTLQVKGVREFTYDYYKVGDPCYDRKTSEYIGDIVNVRKESYLERVVLQDGSLYYSERPGVINIYVDIETNGTETGNAFYAQGTYELKAGSDVNLSTREIEVFARVYNVGVK